MCGSAARTIRNGDSSMSLRIREKRSGGKSWTGLTVCTPALLTTMSTPRATSSAASRSVRSTGQGSPTPRSASSSSAARSRSARRTVAPAADRRTAQARPIPLAAPVTRAVLPVRSTSTDVPAAAGAPGGAAVSERMSCVVMGLNLGFPRLVADMADHHRKELFGVVPRHVAHRDVVYPRVASRGSPLRAHVMQITSLVVFEHRCSAEPVSPQGLSTGGTMLHLTRRIPARVLAALTAVLGLCAAVIGAAALAPRAEA